MLELRISGACKVALPEASSAVTPFVPKVPPAKSAMEQPQVALPEASSAVTPFVPKVPPAKSAMEQPQVALPGASSAVTPFVPKVPPAKSAMEQPQVALPEASSAVTPFVPKVPPAKSAMEQPQVALPEASSAVTPFVPKVPPAKSAMEQPQVALPEASSAVTPSVPKAPPKSTMEQPKVTVQILEDSDSSSSSELEDKTPPSASTVQASHVAQPVTSSSSCLTVGTERPPELDHPSLEVVDQADVPTKVHPEEVRAKAASLQKPEVETERTERECIVDLERGAVSEKWGFQWDREAMDRQQQRVISAVAPNSLAEDWNRRFPGRAVRKGYRLVKVNGVEDYGGIAAELKKKQITCHFEAGH
ncbi:unnamed protein product [Cladocopium goreaui]|uniref:Uncharacterized protein n=1 Tax=Cladocopium goreaui TaxID=2562237 RepID=A0A9P1D4I7_9DINO|nr:unnamed protein product [Cladocopium goreaui]